MSKKDQVFFNIEQIVGKHKNYSDVEMRIALHTLIQSTLFSFSAELGNAAIKMEGEVFAYIGKANGWDEQDQT